MLALVGGTIYVSPTEEPIRDGVVLIQNGRIAAVGGRGLSQASKTLDCSGLTITAGFWNSHVHFFERKWANAAAIRAIELTRSLRFSGCVPRGRRGSKSGRWRHAVRCNR
jgi:cytosine/adenosine deaminase-related metal-dependent hydrolase